MKPTTIKFDNAHPPLRFANKPCLAYFDFADNRGFGGEITCYCQTKDEKTIHVWHEHSSPYSDGKDHANYIGKFSKGDSLEKVGKTLRSYYTCEYSGEINHRRINEVIEHFDEEGFIQLETI